MSEHTASVLTSPNKLTICGLHFGELTRVTNSTTPAGLWKIKDSSLLHTTTLYIRPSNIVDKHIDFVTSH